MNINNPCRPLTAVLVALALLVAGPAMAFKPNSNEPVKLPIMQSSDFDFIITVYGEVLKVSKLYDEESGDEVASQPIV